MGVYNTVAVTAMADRPYDDVWNFVLQSMDIVSLFKLALRSRFMFEVVMGYVRQRMPDSCHKDERELSYSSHAHIIMLMPVRFGGPADTFSTLPVELYSTIFASTDLGTRINLSQVSRKFRALCVRELQACVNHLLLRFSLSHCVIRFMQTATLSVMSGMAIVHALDHDLTPTRLEFLVPKTTYAMVLRFFELATEYDAYPSEVFQDAEGIIHTTTLHHQLNGRMITLSCSRTDSALDPIPYFPFTHLFGAATHYGVWLGYPRTSSARISLPNRGMINFASPETEFRVGNLLRRAVSKFRVQLNLELLHVCGDYPECPMTPRSTIDAGCLNLFFPTAPFGASVQSASVYLSGSGMAWSLDGRACPQRVRPEAEMRNRRDDCE
jgi:hypothetical protein